MRARKEQVFVRSMEKERSVPSVRLGCFGGSGNLEAISLAGFDSAELDIMEISRMPKEGFAEFVRRCRNTGLGFEAFSGFMPLTERIHSPDFDMHKWLNHAKLMGERTSQLGARVWPLGAGKCRSIPEEADFAQAKHKVADFFGGICEAVVAFGITVAVEPLGPANSNYLNRIAQAREFVQELGLANCRIMCDLRHMHSQGEPLAEIMKNATWIVHAHIDCPLSDRRHFPYEGDGFDYQPYIRAVLSSGCSLVLGVEATAYDDFLNEATISATYLRKLICNASTPQLP